MTSEQRFALRYGALRPLMSLLGLGPSLSHVEVRASEVRVAMSWAFRATIPVRSIGRAYVDPDEAGVGVRGGRWSRLGAKGGIGVHGWGGRWLVNGATTGIVTIEVKPPTRALVIGFPVKLRELYVSVEDPEGLARAIGQG